MIYKLLNTIFDPFKNNVINKSSRVVIYYLQTFKKLFFTLTNV